MHKSIKNGFNHIIKWILAKNNTKFRVSQKLCEWYHTVPDRVWTTDCIAFVRILVGLNWNGIHIHITKTNRTSINKNIKFQRCNQTRSVRLYIVHKNVRYVRFILWQDNVRSLFSVLCIFVFLIFPALSQVCSSTTIKLRHI